MFLEYLNFCPGLLGHIGKRLDEKANITFKIYDVTSWKTNNYNKHIVRNLKKLRQSGNEIWSLNRIKREKYFYIFPKVMYTIRQGD